VLVTIVWVIKVLSNSDEKTINMLLTCQWPDLLIFWDYELSFHEFFNSTARNAKT